MSNTDQIAAALSIDALGSDARVGFDLAANAGYSGIAFATSHPELTPDALGQSARRHLRTILSTKNLSIDSLRIAVPRLSLADPSTIDRAMDNARRGILLAQDLGIKTVSLNIGNLTDSKTPQSTIAAALRELAQHADAGGLSLAVGSETFSLLPALLKSVDYGPAKAHMDTARLIAESADPLKMAEEAGANDYASIGQLTAADAIRAGSSLRAAPLGEGQVPFQQLLHILHEQNFSGPTVVDLRDLSNPSESAEHAARILGPLLQRK